MKSKHLAKADFLRRLRELATELYDLGDFTSKDPDREIISAKIQGFADAGQTVEVVTSQEIQQVIDKVHLAKFGEEREARRARVLEEQAKGAAGSEDSSEDVTDWDKYDSPPKIGDDRKQSSKIVQLLQHREG